MKRKRKMILLGITVLCGLIFWPRGTQAALITIQIKAVVDSVQDEGNYLEGKIGVGDIITGFYVYESTTPDSSPLDPVQGNYWHYAPPAGIALTVGGFNFMTDPFNVAFHVALRNNDLSGDESYWLASSKNLALSNGTSVDNIVWLLNDSTANVFSTDALPQTPPLLANWKWNVLDVYADRKYGIRGHVTSAIPEPACIILISIGGLFLRKRS
jgi:hypothetical protein